MIILNLVHVILWIPKAIKYSANNAIKELLLHLFLWTTKLGAVKFYLEYVIIAYSL